MKKLTLTPTQTSLIDKLNDSGVSCKSMLATFFGDVLSHQGGWIWLGSIIDAFAHLGFNERTVRTSVFRLVQSDWLITKKIGRKSYYCLSETGRNETDRAERKIYNRPKVEWDSQWVLVLNVSVPEEKLDYFKKSICWLGFNLLSPGLYAHPSPERRSLDELLIENNLFTNVAVFNASSSDMYSKTSLKTLITEKWQIPALEAMYDGFLNSFRDFLDVPISQLTPEESFSLRLAMLHEYRRIQLKDPDLPSELLPVGWVGFEAQDFLQKHYLQLMDSSTQFICENLLNGQGALPQPNLNFYKRFNF